MRKNKDNQILMSHGDGGVKTLELIKNIIIGYLGNETLNKIEDSAVLK